MTTSKLNRRKRRRERDAKKIERRQERHAGGDWKLADLWHPNRQRDTWHQSKDKR